MFQDVAGTIPAVVNSPVALVRDQSGNGIDAFNATLAQQPLLKLIAGCLALKFDNIDDRLLIGSGSEFNFAQSTIAIAAITANNGQFVCALSGAQQALYPSVIGPWGTYNGGQIFAGYVDTVNRAMLLRTKSTVNIDFYTDLNPAENVNGGGFNTRPSYLGYDGGNIGDATIFGAIVTSDAMTDADVALVQPYMMSLFTPPVTQAWLSQIAPVVADEGDTDATVSQMAIVAAATEIVFAANALISQEVPVAAQTDSPNVANISQLPAVAAISADASLQANVSQIAVIVAAVEPPQRVALYPFTIGNFPTTPMYRR